MKYIFLALLSLVLFASGWFGRGLLDGSLISITKAEQNSQEAVKDALARQAERDAQTPAINRSINKAKDASRIVASTLCAPGAGALSDDAANSLRDAFSRSGDK